MIVIIHLNRDGLGLLQFVPGGGVERLPPVVVARPLEASVDPFLLLVPLHPPVVQQVIIVPVIAYPSGASHLFCVDRTGSVATLRWAGIILYLNERYHWPQADKLPASSQLALEIAK